MGQEGLDEEETSSIGEEPGLEASLGLEASFQGGVHSSGATGATQPVFGSSGSEGTAGLDGGEGLLSSSGLGGTGDLGHTLHMDNSEGPSAWNAPSKGFQGGVRNSPGQAGGGGRGGVELEDGGDGAPSHNSITLLPSVQPGGGQGLEGGAHGGHDSSGMDSVLFGSPIPAHLRPVGQGKTAQAPRSRPSLSAALPTFPARLKAAGVSGLDSSSTLDDSRALDNSKEGRAFGDQSFDAQLSAAGQESRHSGTTHAGPYVAEPRVVMYEPERYAESPEPDLASDQAFLTPPPAPLAHGVTISIQLHGVSAASKPQGGGSSLHLQPPPPLSTWQPPSPTTWAVGDAPRLAGNPHLKPAGERSHGPFMYVHHSPSCPLKIHALGQTLTHACRPHHYTHLLPCLSTS